MKQCKRPKKRSAREPAGGGRCRPGGESSSEEEWQPWMEERPKRRKTSLGECDSSLFPVHCPMQGGVALEQGWCASYLYACILCEGRSCE